MVAEFDGIECDEHRARHKTSYCLAHCLTRGGVGLVVMVEHLDSPTINCDILPFG